MKLLDQASLILRSKAKPGQPSTVNDPQLLAAIEAMQIETDRLSKRLAELERKANGTGGRAYEGAGGDL